MVDSKLQLQYYFTIAVGLQWRNCCTGTRPIQRSLSSRRTFLGSHKLHEDDEERIVNFFVDGARMNDRRVTRNRSVRWGSRSAETRVKRIGSRQHAAKRTKQARWRVSHTTAYRRCTYCAREILFWIHSLFGSFTSNRFLISRRNLVGAPPA